MKQLGQNIKRSRLEANLSLEDAALDAGISSKWLGEIENGKTDPKLSTLQKIAKAVKKEVSDFFEQNGHTYNNYHQQGTYIATQYALQEQIVKTFERLLEEKDARIEELKTQLIEAKQRLEGREQTEKSSSAKEYPPGRGI